MVAAVALTGCYASTEPATGVRFDGAGLNAQGTANSGPASSYFEYWPTASPGARLSTIPRDWPAGAHGPFSETIDADAFPGGPLAAGTAYSFRVCGNDRGASPVCAQTRTFTTPAAGADVVEGSWSFIEGNPHSNRGSVHASSGPAGQNPAGVLRYAVRESAALDYAGRVTCLKVSARHAVVGTVGEIRSDGSAPNPNLNPPNASLVLTVDDGGPGAVDRVSADLHPGIDHRELRRHGEHDLAGEPEPRGVRRPVGLGSAGAACGVLADRDVPAGRSAVHDHPRAVGAAVEHVPQRG